MVKIIILNTCDRCDKDFNPEEKIENKEPDSRKNVCEFCNSSFAHNWNLVYHQTHTKFCLEIQKNGKSIQEPNDRICYTCIKLIRKYYCEVCDKGATFNYPGNKISIRCKKHILDGMVDVKSRKCEFKECPHKPCFNLEGETKGKFCDRHRLPTMVDVVHDLCEFKDGCTTRDKNDF